MTAFTIVTNNIKYLVMTLTKQVKNLTRKSNKSKNQEDGKMSQAQGSAWLAE